MAHSLATERLGERFLLVVGEISLEAVASSCQLSHVRHHMNLRGEVLASDDRLRAIFTWSLHRSADNKVPLFRAVPPEATARASHNSLRSARTSLSVTPSRPMRSCIATSPKSSSRDGWVPRVLHMTSSRRNSVTADELGLNRPSRSEPRARTKRSAMQHVP